MVSPNWGLAGGNNALANFGMGVQLGTQMRQRQKERETDEALAAYAANPTSPDGVNALLKADPRLGIQVMRDQREQQQQVQIDDITRRALGGDDQAMQELAVKNLPAWRALSAEQRDAAAQEAKIFGNAALDILSRPPEQRGAAVASYIQQLGPQYPEVAQIAQLPPEQQEMALRAAVAEAQMMDKLHSLERPDYMAIPAGGTLVDTRNPQAVQQFGQGAVPPPPAGFVLDDGGPAPAPGNFPR